MYGVQDRSLFTSALRQWQKSRQLVSEQGNMNTMAGHYLAFGVQQINTVVNLLRRLNLDMRLGTETE